MITQYEVTAFLQAQIPQLVQKTYPSRASLGIYASVNYFSDFTKHAVEEHNYSLARNCFEMAGKLYQLGDRIVRLVIENSFIYSFSSFMPADKTERLILKSLIPVSLYSIYIKQVYNSAC